MAEGTTFETHSPSPSEDGALVPQPASGSGLKRALLFAGLAAVSAGIAFLVVRATMRQAPSDPTSERIEALIEEANRLLRELDDQKRA
ncbi:MAG: hypothetical protein ABI346_05820 [Candidatus Baltobacteraceae bacterium]